VVGVTSSEGREEQNRKLYTVATSCGQTKSVCELGAVAGRKSENVGGFPGVDAAHWLPSFCGLNARSTLVRDRWLLEAICKEPRNDDPRNSIYAPISWHACDENFRSIFLVQVCVRFHVNCIFRFLCSKTGAARPVASWKCVNV
jgi:hypothetical protein